jgi:aspartate kinase
MNEAGNSQQNLLQNLVVQKYGGTSVATPSKIKGVAHRIAQVHSQGSRVLVVVSAMGHTTDELLALAAQVSPQPQRRELDMLLTAGERISMALLSMALTDLGVACLSFTGSQAGIITDEVHTEARIVEIKPTRVLEALEQNKVVILAGFQGVSRTKEITTLGRGGSDTTALAMAAALGASRCEILTDVRGVYSADPNLVTEARHYPELPLELVLEMAQAGAQVMHTRALETALDRAMAFWVGHSVEVAKGTWLRPWSQMAGTELPPMVAVCGQPLLGQAVSGGGGAVTVIGPHLADRLAKDKTLLAPIASVTSQPQWQGLCTQPRGSHGICFQGPALEDDNRRHDLVRELHKRFIS